MKPTDCNDEEKSELKRPIPVYFGQNQCEQSSMIKLVTVDSGYVTSELKK